MWSHRIVLWLGVTLGALAMIGCSEETDPPAAASILSFQTSSAEIEFGRSATLSWATKDANRVEIVEVGGQSVPTGDAPASRGSVLVAPTSTTHYELRAYGKAGAVASERTVVHVIPGEQAPAVVSFTADPDVVSLGEDAVLSWITADATSIRIVDAAGTPVAVSKGDGAARGQITIKPRGSTTYHLTAAGPAGEAEAEVAVDVHGQPSITLKAPGQAMEPGATATLHWTATGAQRVTITDEFGAMVYDGNALESHIQVQPTYSTAFTAVARGAKGEGTARATVSVRPVIDVFHAHVARPIYPGEEVELQWQVRGARELAVLRNGFEPWYVQEADFASGTARLAAGVDTSFRLRARSGSMIAESQVSVERQPVPRIVEMGISPVEVTADEGYSSDVTVSWFIDAASRIKLETQDGRQIDVNSVSPRKGSVAVSVNGPTTFRLTAFNDHGATIAEREIVAHRRATIDTFQFLPVVAAPGEAVTLFWETTDGSTVSIEKLGEGLIGTGLPGAVGSFSNVVHAESSYVLKAYNPLGYETVSEPIEVPIGVPEIESFVIDRYFVRPGLPITLSWSNIGGQQLVIKDETGAVVNQIDGNPCSTTDLFRIVEGSCVVPAPSVGEHTYTLYLRNGASPATELTASAGVESVSGPVIIDFEVVDRATVGRPVTFRWETTEDVEGNFGFIELLADGEVFYSTTKAEPTGSIQHVFTTPGVFPVTIRSHSDEGEHRVSRTLDIRGVAVIESFSASPVDLDSSEGTVASTFSWAWQNGWAARIHKVGPQGQLILPPVLELDGAAQNGPGTINYEPGPGQHEFALVVENLAGSRAEARGVTLRSDMVRVSLDADRVNVSPGDNTVALTVDVRHASAVNMPITSSTLYSVAEINKPFIDISDLPEKVVHPRLGSDNDAGYFDVTFPSGFSFPFDGKQRNQARVWIDGVVSFNQERTTSFSNERLPVPSSTSATDNKRAIHLAIFWDDLTLKRNDTRPLGWVSSALTADDKGPMLVIQWSELDIYAAVGSFNFQTVLRPDGSFEYRYGRMQPVSGSDAAIGNGSSATIGYQNYLATAGYTFSHNTAVSGGLANRSWSYQPPTVGSAQPFTVQVESSGNFSVLAWNDYSSASDSISFTYWATPTATLTASAAVDVGTEFPLHWSASNATRIQIVNETTGTIVCTHDSPDGKAASLGGSCVDQRQEGVYTYKLRAIGGYEGNAIEKTATVMVYRPFSARLIADKGGVRPGESVTLSWETVGASTYALTANGVDIPIPQTPTGSIQHSPTVATTYVLTVRDAPGAGLQVRTLTGSKTILYRTNTLDEVQVPGGKAGPPGYFTFSWGSTDASRVYFPGRFLAQELPERNRFVDLSLAGSGAQRFDRTWGSLDQGGFVFNLPAGFSFTYDGQAVTTVTASSNGWLSFQNIASDSLHTNTILPNSGSSQLKVHLAPFWDDLDTSNVYMAQGIDPQFGRHVTIQWASYPNAESAGNLRFQVVLYDSGAVEYRYGTMTSTTMAKARGSLATIGIQNRTGTSGTTISFDKEVPGGLSGKSFMFWQHGQADGSGSIYLSEPGRHDVVICSTDGRHDDCQTVTIVVLQPGDLLVTEMMVSPVTGADGQWIEVRNVAPFEIDLQGLTIQLGDVSQVITRSIPIPSGQFAVLSRGDEASNGGVQADYVYGNSMELSAAGGTLALKHGTLTIDSITWTGAWPFPAGRSLMLDPSYHMREAGNGVSSRWCTSTDPLAGGATGSPGYRGTGCRLVHYDTEWFSDRPFIDIESTGVPLDKLNGDDPFHSETEPQAIGFAFPFFGGTVSQWWGAANGFISFTALTGGHSGNTTIPNSSAPNNMVAAFWDDLINQTGSSVKTQLMTREGFPVRIIQWSRVRALGTTGTITFQIQLWGNGDIVLGYKDITGSTEANLRRNLGSEATIGIENAAASSPGDGLAFSVDKPSLYKEGRVLAFEKKN